MMIKHNFTTKCH